MYTIFLKFSCISVYLSQIPTAFDEVVDNLAESIPLADRIFTELSTAIVKGELAPGERVPEQQLVERFGGSRSSVREAIQRLEARHLIVRVPNVGARVAQLSLEELRDIYEVRVELEGMACRLATQRMTDEEVQELSSLLESHKQTIDAEQGQSYYQKAGDLDFHYCIIQGSKNTRLQQMLLGDLYHQVRMYRYQTSTGKQRPEKALEEHQRIVEAIANRDAELAELLMRRHIQISLNNLEAKLKEQSKK